MTPKPRKQMAKLSETQSTESPYFSKSPVKDRLTQPTPRDNRSATVPGQSSDHEDQDNDENPEGVSENEDPPGDTRQKSSMRNIPDDDVGATMRSRRWRESIVTALHNKDFGRIGEFIDDAYEAGGDEARQEAEELLKRAGLDPTGNPITPRPTQGSELTALVAAMTASFQNLRPNASVPDGGDIKEFNGKPAELDWWLASIEARFRLFPDYFTNDKTKVAWALTRISSTLQYWVYGLNESQGHEIKNWSRFKAYMTESFGSSSLKWDKIHRLDTIHQTTSVGDFIVQWEELVSSAKLDVEQVKLFFVAKLKPAVKEQLQLQGLTGKEEYREFKVKARTMDEAIFAKQISSNKAAKENQGTNKKGSSTPAYTNRNHQPNEKQQNAQTKGKLTDEEKKYRRDNNLCLYCGKADHRVKDCTWLKEGTQPPQTTQTTNRQPASDRGVMDSYRPSYRDDDRTRTRSRERPREREQNQRQDRQPPRQGALKARAAQVYEVDSDEEESDN